MDHIVLDNHAKLNEKGHGNPSMKFCEVKLDLFIGPILTSTRVPLDPPQVSQRRWEPGDFNLTPCLANKSNSRSVHSLRQIIAGPQEVRSDI